MENATISPMADVRTFFYFLMVEMDLGGSFHPDIPICDYVNAESGKNTFSHAMAGRLQERLEYCFDVCDAESCDIYETGLQLAQRLGFSPRPDASQFGESISMDARLSPLHLKAYPDFVMMHWDGLKMEVRKANWPLVKAFCNFHLG